MTRSIIWIILCLALIFVINAVVDQTILHTCNDMDMQIEQIEQAVLREDWESAQGSIGQMTQRWQKSRYAWEAVADHSDVETINILMSRIDQMAGDEDAQEFLPELRELKTTLEHVRMGQKVAWYNIF